MRSNLWKFFPPYRKKTTTKTLPWVSLLEFNAFSVYNIRWLSLRSSNWKWFAQKGLSHFRLKINILSSVAEIQTTQNLQRISQTFRSKIYWKSCPFRFASFDDKINLQKNELKKNTCHKNLLTISHFQWHDKHIRMDGGDQLCLHKTVAVRARIIANCHNALLCFYDEQSKRTYKQTNKQTKWNNCEIK